MNEPSEHNHTPASAAGARTTSGPAPQAASHVHGPTPPPPPPPPPPPSAFGQGMETVEVLTKTVLPMLLGSDGKMAKWLPMVAGGAILGAGLGYALFRDQQRPRSTPRPTTQHVTTSGVPAPVAHAHAHPGHLPGPVMMTRVGVGEFPLGFVYESVPGKKRAGKGKQQRNVVDVTSRPQFIFRGEYLRVPSSIAQQFDIVDIKVAGRSQLVGSAALPAATFAENVVSKPLRMETASVAQDITLVVENLTPQARRFSASLVGTVID